MTNFIFIIGWSWITPEDFAKHIARRVQNEYGDKQATVLDAFCGVGGNTIQFAKKCKHVVATDLDPSKTQHTAHNSEIYNTRDNITVFPTDYLTLNMK